MKKSKGGRVDSAIQQISEFNGAAIEQYATWIKQQGRLNFASMAVGGVSDSLAISVIECLTVLGLGNDVAALRKANEVHKQPSWTFGRLDGASVVIVTQGEGVPSKILGILYLFSVRVTEAEREVAHAYLRPDMPLAEFLERPSCVHYGASSDPKYHDVQMATYNMVAPLIDAKATVYVSAPDIASEGNHS